MVAMNMCINYSQSVFIIVLKKLLTILTLSTVSVSTDNATLTLKQLMRS